MKLYIATPMVTGMCHGGFALSLSDLVAMLVEKGIEYEVEFLYQNSMIQLARNTLAHNAMETNSTHLLFIDSDISFDAGDLMTMLELTEKRKLSVVGGCYVLKDPDRVGKLGQPVCTTFSFDKADLAPDEDGLLAVRGVGTGLMLIDMQILERLAEINPTFPHDGMIFSEIFKVKVLPDGILPEDFGFCDDVRERLGESVYMFANIKSKHYGQHAYCWGA